MNNQDLCPCGTRKKYQSCCQIAHNNIQNASTAESLMRSRYSAFVKADIDYLLKSWSFKTRNNSKKFKKDLLEWTISVEWIKLDIINIIKGSKSDTTGNVSFKAFYYENGKLECITENSFFEKENGHWVYV